jgi:hypothetical protein
MKMRASLLGDSRFLTWAILIMALFTFAARHIFSLQHTNLVAAKLSPARIESPNASYDVDKAATIKAYGNLPMSFAQNLGQTDPRVKFLSSGAGYALFLTPQEAVLSLQHSGPAQKAAARNLERRRLMSKARSTALPSVLRLVEVGANPASSVLGLDRLPGRTDYFIGNDPKNWRADVPSYARVKYQDIYPGVDLIFYGNHRRLEHDFVLAPGVDPAVIHLRIEGARSLRIDKRGNLAVRVPGGAVALEKPDVYQEIQGVRREVAANYVLAADRSVSFKIGTYDATQALVIDPVLDYSTYLGGSATGDDAFGIAVDGNGDAFVTGVTSSATFPTNNGVPPPVGQAFPTVFVTELNPAGTATVYSTYLSGTAAGTGLGIAVAAGKIYVTGQTMANDFPVTAGTAYNATGAPSHSNAKGIGFLSVLDPTKVGLASLAYSTYFGGSGAASGGDISLTVAADGTGSAFLAGVSTSPDFPLKNNIPPPGADVLPSVAGSGFVARIDTGTSGSAGLIYSTFLGGNGVAGTLNGGAFGDVVLSVTADANKNAFVTGETTSTDFPTTANAFQGAAPTGAANGAVFVSRINTTLSGSASLTYSTYLEGATVNAFGDIGRGIALGPAPNSLAYVTGSTSSPLFPTTAGAPSMPAAGNGNGVAFVSQIDTGAANNSLKYSATIGGTGGDSATGVQVDGQGNAYVSGGSGSANFPTTPGAFQGSFAPGAFGDGFLFKLNPGGNGAADLVYSSFFGGTGSGASVDGANGIAIDPGANPNVYITGVTFSNANFPVFPQPGALQTALIGTSSAFVAKLTLSPVVSVAPNSITFVPAVLVGNTSQPQFVTLTNNTGQVVPYTLTKTGADPGDFAAAPGAPAGGTPCPAGSLAANTPPCTIGVTFKPSIANVETANLVIGYTAFGVVNSQTVTLNGTGTNMAVSLAPGNVVFPGQLVTTTSAAMPVVLSNSSASAIAISAAVTGDFAETDNCGANLAANSTCTYNVTFKPTADANPRVGTLIVTSNGNPLPTVNLSGTAQDFSLTAPAAFSLRKGQSGNFQVNGNWIGGYAQPLMIACTGAPSGATCVPNPNSVTPGSPNSSIMITTKGSSVPPNSTPNPPVNLRQVTLVLAAVLLLACLPIVRRRASRVTALMVVMILIILAGCAGGGTPTGKTNLTLTVSSGGVNQVVNVQLTVN